jgi:hypothetical protein
MVDSDYLAQVTLPLPTTESDNKGRLDFPGVYEAVSVSTMQAVDCAIVLSLFIIYFRWESVTGIPDINLEFFPCQEDIQ